MHGNIRNDSNFVKCISIITFLLMIAYWPNTYGAATTLRWALLWITLPFLIMQKGLLIQLLKFQWLMIVFFGYAIISLIWTPFRLDGILEVITLLTLWFAIILGQNLELRYLSIIMQAAAI